MRTETSGPVSPEEKWAVAMLNTSATRDNVYVLCRAICDEVVAHDFKYSSNKTRTVCHHTIAKMLRTGNYRIVDRFSEAVMVHRDSPRHDASGPLYKWQSVLERITA